MWLTPYLCVAAVFLSGFAQGIQGLLGVNDHTTQDLVIGVCFVVLGTLAFVALRRG